MKFSKKGIGWLIFGLIVCFSATEGDDIADIVSSIMLGLVFVAIYLMKQKFDPKGIGWFIGGGVLLAFCSDQLLTIAAGLVRSFSIIPGDLSDMFISLIISCILLYVFYSKNKDALDCVADGYEPPGEFEFPYQKEVFKETTVEETVQTVEETVIGGGTEQVVTPDGSASGDSSVVEIEVTE